MSIVILEDSCVDKNNLVGGAIIGLRNIKLMVDVFGEQNVQMLPYTLHSTDTQKGKLLRKLFFFNAGMTFWQAENIAGQIARIKPNIVFINTALYGVLVKKIKKRSPSTRIITFFHNVEYDFFCDLTRTKKKYIGGIIRKLVKSNENKSVTYSDTLITLNERDSQRLGVLYGRRADLILPTSFEDVCSQLSPTQEMPYCDNKTRLLFVGFNFYANLEGISWFVDRVMPVLGLDFKLSIVGRAMEREAGRLNRENVEVIGSVDDLAWWYQNSDIVVLPIFAGSGMKTKTAEAMMYGKPIIASKESFEGYEIDDYQLIGAMCQTAEQFVEQIKLLSQNPELIKQKGNKARELFLTKYAYNNILTKAKAFFNGKG